MEPDKIQIDKKTNQNIGNYFTVYQKKNYHSSKDFYRPNIKHRNIWGPLGEVDWIEKECDFVDFGTKVFVSKIITSTTHKTIREKLLKKGYLDVPKVIEQIHKITYLKKTKRALHRKL